MTNVTTFENKYFEESIFRANLVWVHFTPFFTSDAREFPFKGPWHDLKSLQKCVVGVKTKWNSAF